MKKQNKNDNAANRKSYVGKVYNLGEKQEKKRILSSLKPEWAKLHEEGYIHIHDLDAYGLTYNCLTFDILNAFPEINPIWLQTGEGEMILPRINSPVEQRVNGDGNKFSGSGDVSDGVPASLLQQALNEITEMRQLLAESVRNTNDLSQRLMNLLESRCV